MIQIRKEFRFEASHRLVSPNLTHKQNLKTYGKCYDCISHGHSYRLGITISGNIHNNGMIINFKDLNEIVTKLIINKVDHKFLNEEVSFLKGKPTTCENMVVSFWRIIDRYLTTNKIDAFLSKIELWETENSKAVMEINNADCAWLAGLIDGDGTISIFQIQSKRKKQYKHTFFQGRISISNSKKELLNQIVKLFPQFRLYCRPHQSIGVIQVTSKPLLKKTLLQVLPYLTIKRQQACLLLQYCDYNVMKRNQIKALCNEIQKLNQTGIIKRR